MNSRIWAAIPQPSIRFKFVLFLYSCHLLAPTTVDALTGEKISHCSRRGLCRELSKLWPWMKNYHKFSFCLHSFCVVYYLLFWRHCLDPTSGFYCHSPRPIYSRYLEPRHSIILAWQFSAITLIWRTIVTCWRSYFVTDLVAFVVNESDEDKKSSEFNSNCYNWQKVMNLQHSSTFLHRQTGKESLILRPNRTPAAKKLLFDRIDEIFRWSSVSATAVLVVMTAAVLSSVIDEQREISMAPQCGHQTAEWTISLRTVGSYLLTMFYIAEGLPAFLYQSGLNSTILFDLNVYWQHIQLRIERLRLQLSYSNNIRNNKNNNYTSNENFYHNRSLKEPLGLYRRGRGPKTQFASKRRSISEADERIIVEVAKLHASLKDFFEQVHRTDAFESFLVTLSMTIWFGSNAIFTATGVQFDNSNRYSKSIRIIQFGIFCLIWQLNMPILAFKARVESTYASLCSVMALDQTKCLPIKNNLPQTKWIGVMSYYTHGARYSFTLFGAHIYSRLTFLTFISYTITLVFLLEGFRIQHSFD